MRRVTIAMTALREVLDDVIRDGAVKVCVVTEADREREEVAAGASKQTESLYPDLSGVMSRAESEVVLEPLVLFFPLPMRCRCRCCVLLER